MIKNKRFKEVEEAVQKELPKADSKVIEATYKIAVVKVLDEAASLGNRCASLLAKGNIKQIKKEMDLKGLYLNNE